MALQTSFPTKPLFGETRHQEFSRHQSPEMPIHPTKNYSLLLTIGIVLIFCVALAFPRPPLLSLLADSEQYKAMSDAIFSGSFLQPIDLSQRSQLASAMRPPLYPLLLGVAQRIPGVDINDALISLHLLLGYIILATAPWALRKCVSPPLTACATGIALFSAKQVLYGAMSEWLAMTFVFVCVLSYVSWRVHQRWAGSALTVTFLSLAILTRSALLPLLTLAPLMLVQSDRDKRWGTLTGITIGLLPLCAWATLNLARLDSFTLGKYEGLNLLATARSLGTIPSSPQDSPETLKFIEYINTKGMTPSPSAFATDVVHQWDGEYYAAFHRNFDTSCDAMIEYGSKGSPRIVALAARSLTAHRENYRGFLLGGWHTFSRLYAPILGLCALASLWLSRRAPSMSIWSSSVFTVCTLSLFYLGSVFCTILWLHRYIMPIQPALIFCTVITVARLVASFRDTKRITKI